MKEQECVLTDEVQEKIKVELETMRATAFEAGRQAGILEAKEVAEVGKRQDAMKRTTPLELAARAGDLQAMAAKAGEKLSDIDAVKAASREAGIPY